MTQQQFVQEQYRKLKSDLEVLDSMYDETENEEVLNRSIEVQQHILELEYIFPFLGK